MDPKKYPILTVSLAAFGLVAVTGVVLVGIAWYDGANAQKRLDSTRQNVRRLLGEHIAGTPQNKDLSKANLDALLAAEKWHREDLAGARSEEFSKNLDSDPGAFASNLNSTVIGWRKGLDDAGVKLVTAKPEDFAFGFSRYYKTGVNPPQSDTKDLSRQTKIVDFIVRTLLEVKSSSSLSIVEFGREPVEIPTANRNTLARDEMTVQPDPVFRRQGLIHAEAFRVRFLSHTDVLRRFVNALTDSGRALIVRGVELGPASPEILHPSAVGTPSASTPTNLFSDALTCPAPAEASRGPHLIVPGDPFDVTVTLEFIEPLKSDIRRADDPPMEASPTPKREQP